MAKTHQKCYCYDHCVAGGVILEQTVKWVAFCEFLKLIFRKTCLAKGGRVNRKFGRWQTIDLKTYKLANHRIHIHTQKKKFLVEVVMILNQCLQQPFEAEVSSTAVPLSPKGELASCRGSTRDAAADAGSF